MTSTATAAAEQAVSEHLDEGSAPERQERLRAVAQPGARAGGQQGRRRGHLFVPHLPTVASDGARQMAGWREPKGGHVAEHFATIDDYIASCPAEVRRILEEIRRTIRSTVPEAAETISYGMPTLYARRQVPRVCGRLEALHQHLPGSRGP